MKRRQLLKHMAVISAATLLTMRAGGALTTGHEPRGDFAWARAGELPLGWDGVYEDIHSYDLLVIDRDTGREITQVFEVDAARGWLRRYRDGYPAIGGRLQTETLHGNFAIRRKDSS